MAKADPQALARLFDKSPEKRKKLHDDPEAAAREAGLPDELVKHFKDLKPPERRALSSTWDEMEKAGYVHDQDGATVSFL